MTVASTANSIQHDGNDVTATFSTGQVVFYEDSDLIVYTTTISTGVQDANLTLGVDYTVSGGDGAAGNITLTAGALSSTKRITIIRAIPRTQLKEFNDAEETLFEELEEAFDRSVIIAQQNAEDASNSIKVPVGTSIPSTTISGVIDATAKVLTISSTEVAASTISTFGDLDVVDTGAASGDLLVYGGSNWIVLKNNNTATTAPTVNDDSGVGYTVGSRWHDITADEAYTCLDATVGAAVWLNTTLTIDDLGTSATRGFIDDDTMATASSTTTASSESVKAYIDNEISGTGITLETEQATTSGTNFDFTSIPAGTNRITVMLEGVSLSGTDSLLVQIGDSGGIETTSYDSLSSDSAGNDILSTAGFIVRGEFDPVVITGAISISRMSGNKWVAAGSLKNADRAVVASGIKTLSGELTQIRLTRTGTNTFDAGSVNISIE